MVRTSSLAAVVVLGTSVFFLASPSLAHAQPQRDSELTTLQQDLDREATALSTSDCAVACRALASIRRAAERICALDPDVRCADARAKADAATKKVRAACPGCALASGPSPSPNEPMPATVPPPVPPAPPPARESSAKTSAGSDQPQPESRRGGCAGCTSTGATPSNLAGVSLALTGLLVLLRRRAKKALGSRK